MGLFDFLKRLFGLKPPPSGRKKKRRSRTRPRNIKLQPLRYRNNPNSEYRQQYQEFDKPPYRFAGLSYQTLLGEPHKYLDFSGDGDASQLAELGLPSFHTPDALADWLMVPVGKLAWLAHRFDDGYRPESVQKAHYHYRWIKKRTGGVRLIEAPKTQLKSVQNQILHGILNAIPPHEQAHGFVKGSSPLTNARPHVGKRVVLKFDLENFYASVSFARVVAIFRRVGYSREAALWLARLTTSALPRNMPFPDGDPYALRPFLPRHLPQGAPTSPALANLSAFALDVRLSGMSRSFGAAYTRYADDLTFSGSEQFLRSFPVFIPLVSKIIRSERFRINRKKRRVTRNNQRQTVTGVVVNERTNVSRKDFDRLKAILHNCLKEGPTSQNHDAHEDFAAHLRGRIAYVNYLNSRRGARLLEMFERIDWHR